MLTDLFILTKTNVYLIVIIAVLYLSGCVFVAIGYWRERRGISVAYITMGMGALLNTFVKVLNGGRFPVNGVTMLDIQEKGYRVWNYIPGDNAKFNILGDHPEIGFASVGDLFIFVGIAIILFYILARLFLRGLRWVRKTP